jgi:hypothetical protein
MLEDGRYASISEMAKAEGVERGYVGSLLRLTLLAPEMVEAIVAGRQPEGVTLLRLMAGFNTKWGRSQAKAEGYTAGKVGVTPAGEASVAVKDVTPKL